LFSVDATKLQDALSNQAQFVSVAPATAEGFREETQFDTTACSGYSHILQPLTYFTPWCRILFEKLIATQSVKKKILLSL
jgi:hypothetical protein